MLLQLEQRVCILEMSTHGLTSTSLLCSGSPDSVLVLRARTVRHRDRGWPHPGCYGVQVWRTVSVGLREGQAETGTSSHTVSAITHSIHQIYYVYFFRLTICVCFHCVVESHSVLFYIVLILQLVWTLNEQSWEVKMWQCGTVERTKASCCRKFQILDSDNFIDPREGDACVAYWSTITQATYDDLVADVNKATQAVLTLNG